MVMNVLTQERVAGAVLSAMKREGLMNKEAAEIFGFSPTYMSMIIRSSSYVKVPRKAWEAMHDWLNAGVPLRGYKSSLKEEPQVEEVAEMKLQSKLATKQLVKEHQDKLAAAVADSVNTEEPIKADKKRIAAKTRKVYEREHKPETAEEVTRVETKDGKVDLSGIDFRTGVLAVLEIYEDGFVLRTKIPVKQ